MCRDTRVGHVIEIIGVSWTPDAVFSDRLRVVPGPPDQRPADAAGTPVYGVENYFLPERRLGAWQGAG